LCELFEITPSTELSLEQLVLTETKHFRILNKIFCRFDPNHLSALQAILEVADPSTPERISLTELTERSHRKIHELLRIKDEHDSIKVEIE
jgi:hypothetical protein